MRMLGVAGVCAVLMGVHAWAVELVANPGFETVDDKGGPAEWGWWTREPGAGRMELSDERHDGERSLRIIHTGEKDWCTTNSRRTPVEPGESYAITCWMKRAGDARGNRSEWWATRGELVSWSIGRTAERAVPDGMLQSWFTVRIRHGLCARRGRGK